MIIYGQKIVWKKVFFAFEKLFEMQEMFFMKNFHLFSLLDTLHMQTRLAKHKYIVNNPSD